MARNGLPYLPLDADDWLNDEAVMLMSAEAEGCYIRLLCRSWKSKTPGVISVELVPVMCGLTRVQAEDRERVLSEMSRAFYVTQTEWTQKRMQVEWKAADRRYRAMTDGARKTNAAKHIARLASANRDGYRTPTVTGSARLPGTGVGVGVGLGVSETGFEVRSTSPAGNAKSEPIALQSGKSKPDPTAVERATCVRCHEAFHRPVGSQRGACPTCHDEGFR